jgi:hypothetical protein
MATQVAARPAARGLGGNALVLEKERGCCRCGRAALGVLTSSKAHRLGITKDERDLFHNTIRKTA